MNKERTIIKLSSNERWKTRSSGRTKHELDEGIPLVNDKRILPRLVHLQNSLFGIRRIIIK